MVIKIRQNTGRSLSHLIKELYAYFPQFSTAPFHKYLHISQLTYRLKGFVPETYIYKQLLQHQSYLAVELPAAEGVYVHPDTVTAIVKKYLTSKLRPAIKATDKIANRNLHQT